MDQNFPTQALNTSILIYSIKQTLRPKKIRDRSLDPRKNEGVNFQLEKTRRTPRHVYCEYPPGDPRSSSQRNRQIKRWGNSKKSPAVWAKQFKAES